MSINVLNPAVAQDQIEVLAKWCNQHNTDSLQLLDVAVSLALVELLEKEGSENLELDENRYRECLKMTGKIGRFLIEQCVNDKQRLLGVTFLLKAMINPLIEKGE
ncbi:MAG: hypothetical protein AB1426_01170 [Bacillota bacterium]